MGKQNVQAKKVYWSKDEMMDRVKDSVSRRCNDWELAVMHAWNNQGGKGEKVVTWTVL